MRDGFGNPHVGNRISLWRRHVHKERDAQQLSLPSANGIPFLHTPISLCDVHVARTPPSTREFRMHIRTIARVLALASCCFVARSAIAQASPKDGLYLMTRYWSGSGLEIDAYYVRAGQIVRSPSRNVAQIDFAAERAQSPARVGQMQMKGDQLTVTWGDGHKTESRVERSAGDPCFSWDGGSFCPVERFANGATLSGSFEGGASAGADGSRVANARDISFKADGTYTMDMSATVSSRTNESRASAGSTGQESGHYQLNGTLLHLMPTGKAAYDVLVFPYTMDDAAKVKPDHLYFGGTMLKRSRMQ